MGAVKDSDYHLHLRLTRFASFVGEAREPKPLNPEP